jgi:DNA-binding transcriptional regulator YiaG
MPESFTDFMSELDAEAHAAGAEAVVELEAFRLHFSLARQLAERRRGRHLTQRQLADLSGIDQAEISRIERGQANPTNANSAPDTRAGGRRATRRPLTRGERRLCLHVQGVAGVRCCFSSAKQQSPGAAHESSRMAGDVISLLRANSSS